MTKIVPGPSSDLKGVYSVKSFASSSLDNSLFTAVGAEHPPSHTPIVANNPAPSIFRFIYSLFLSTRPARCSTVLYRATEIRSKSTSTSLSKTRPAFHRRMVAKFLCRFKAQAGWERRDKEKTAATGFTERPRSRRPLVADAACHKFTVYQHRVRLKRH